MKSKIIHISLSFLIIGSITISPIFIVYKHLHKRQIKSLLLKNIPESTLVHFQFSISQLNALNWHEDSEFELNGNMYDVVEKHIDSSNIVHLFCINDKTEEKLNKQIETHRRNTSAHNSLSIEIKKIFDVQNDFQRLDTIDHHDNDGYYHEAYSPIYINNYESCKTLMGSPPPRCL